MLTTQVISVNLGGYTLPVPPTALGGRIRQLRGDRTLADINKVAKVGVPKLSKLERGDERNPRLATLQRVADGLGVPLAALFDPRSERSGDEESSGSIGLADSLRRALHEYEQTGEAPKDWRGDVLVAILALTRALQRPAAAAGVDREVRKAQ